MSEKQLLLSLDASEAIRKERFHRDGPLTGDMIGRNWLAEKIFASNQPAYTLEKTGVILNITENETQIIITL